MATVYHGAGFALCEDCGDALTDEQKRNHPGGTIAADEHEDACIGDTCDTCGAFLVDTDLDAEWYESGRVREANWYECERCDHKYPTSYDNPSVSCPSCLHPKLVLMVEDEEESP